MKNLSSNSELRISGQDINEFVFFFLSKKEFEKRFLTAI